MKMKRTMVGMKKMDIEIWFDEMIEDDPDFDDPIRNKKLMLDNQRSR